MRVLGRSPSWSLACAAFVFFALVLPLDIAGQLADPDTYWHIAAGDLIRGLGALPQQDTWSFTAGQERWLNISWAWDISASFVHQWWGWQGVIALNTVTIALALAIVFYHCLERCGQFLPCFLLCIFLASGVLGLSARPMQMSLLFCACQMLLLWRVDRGLASPRYLALLPLMMVAWVNMHGGFLVGLLIVGVYMLAALRDGKKALSACCALTLLGCLAACVLNPLGVGIAEAALRTLSSVAKGSISEWQPASFSSKGALYIGLFLIAVSKPLGATRAEKWLSLAWLVACLFSIRHIGIFAIVTAPMLVCYVQAFLAPKTTAPLPAWLSDLGCKLHQAALGSTGMLVGLLACSLACAWLVSAPAKTLYAMEPYPVLDLTQEIAWIEKHAPNARLMNDYDLGGPLIYYARGAIPVWVDGRTETAYPKSLMLDYMKFFNATSGWEQSVETYHLDGAIISNRAYITIDRFKARKGWKPAFQGKTATIFLREPTQPRRQTD